MTQKPGFPPIRQRRTFGAGMTEEILRCTQDDRDYFATARNDTEAWIPAPEMTERAGMTETKRSLGFPPDLKVVRAGDRDDTIFRDDEILPTRGGQALRSE